MHGKTIIIAEAGVNHNGSIDMAKKLIDAAAESGVDYVKFQIWKTDEILVKNAPKAKYQIDNDGDSSQYEMAKRLELTFNQYIELYNYCESVGVKFLATPDDYPSLDFLTETISQKLIKIGSGEINNIPFLKRIGKKGVDVILSTGMSNIGEVELAYTSLIKSGAPSVSILHCTSSYPAPFETLNLLAIQTLKTVFQTKVGYSDHTLGTEASIAAVALGAQIIEKHFTIDKNLPGPDHKASIEPEELTLMVKQIRNIEKALLGGGLKRIQNIEVETRSVVTKGIYIKSKIKKGDIICEDKMRFMRPVSEIPVNLFDHVVNRKALKDISEGEPLKWSDIDFE